MALSILHRMTGVAMAFGLVFFALWLKQLAGGPETYQYFRVAFSTPIGLFLLIAFSFAFFYHLSNGIRHLFWDAGKGFEIHQANRSSWFVLIATVALTAGFWGMAL